MRILRSKEAAASVNIKTWPTIIDTGMCLHIIPQLFLKKQQGGEIIFCFVMIGLCSYTNTLCSDLQTTFLAVDLHRSTSRPQQR